jgi:type I restriction enzyme M protein
VSAFQNISKIEDSLWEAADQLRANSKLTSSEYCMPVLGVIFLRHATNRYDAPCKPSRPTRRPARCPSERWSKGTSSSAAR